MTSLACYLQGRGTKVTIDSTDCSFVPWHDPESSFRGRIPKVAKSVSIQRQSNWAEISLRGKMKSFCFPISFWVVFSACLDSK